ncbi:hypothetical protein [Phenylobacterium sp. J367]|uniref:hypothetical protein n=1 Tax=Phenylobacterium sp. J367 TaxID=2898435 RepID=UPI002151E0B5|nr:hypothetical protein [Phenylobacterium sp. J367]MCR5878208.1 hypothetical protein [Phenylobacterium sp. J367]
MGYSSRRSQSEAVAGAFARSAVTDRMSRLRAEASGGEDLDLLTAMALCRATVRALMSISALSHHEMVTALEHEIAAHEKQDEPNARVVAQMLKLHLKEHA